MVRAVLLDPTFRRAVPLANCADSTFLGGIPALEPNYKRLLNSDHREAFKLAIANEQRPYQFCGNTAVAVLLAAICWLISLSKQERYRFRILLAFVLLVASALGLYGGARASYYRYMGAIAAINGVAFEPVDSAGRPCIAPDRTPPVSAAPH